MANNLFANVPAATIAKQTISFASAGFNTSNVYIIYEVGSPMKSWDPSRAINSVTTFTENKGYYIVPKTSMDMEAIVAPPLPTGGSGTPAAPTVGVVDDTANTFNWTNNPLFPDVSDYETTINGGSAWITAVAKPLVVGDVSLAIGQVGVRVKAVGGNAASAGLFNATAFNVAGGGGATFLVLTSSGAQPLTESPTGTWNAAPPAQGWGVSTESIPSSGIGHIEARYLTSDDIGAVIGLKLTQTHGSYLDMKWGVWPSGPNYWVVNDGSISDSGVACSINDYYRIVKVSANSAKAQKSTNGTTWTDIGSTFVYTSSAEMFGAVTLVGNRVSELKGNGFS